MLRIFAGLLLMLTFQLGNAAIDTYEFNDEQAQKLFRSLTEELRCPKCQNQNLADSNSPIASDLRREVHRMVQEGGDRQQIVDFMVARYGEFVLYKPRLTVSTYLLWYGPWALLVIGVLVVFLIIRKKPKQQAQQQVAGTLDGQQRQRLDELLASNTEEREQK